jgi:hypothetical protein
METDSKQPTGADANAMPWLNDLKKLIEKYQLPGVDVAALVEWQRKDMEALAEANRQASEGIKAASSGATRSCRRRSRSGRRH